MKAISFSSRFISLISVAITYMKAKDAMKKRSILALSGSAWLNKRLSTSTSANSMKGKPRLSGYISLRFPQPTRMKYRAKKPNAASTA